MDAQPQAVKEAVSLLVKSLTLGDLPVPQQGTVAVCRNLQVIMLHKLQHNF